MRVTDGPNGARGPTLPGLGERPTPSACVPCGAALGATWDPELVERVGRAAGRGGAHQGLPRAAGADGEPAPVAARRAATSSRTPRIRCSPGGWRPRSCAALQSQGVATTVKHFAGNESEVERMTANSVIDERSLRELYLLPFELAVREGGSLGHHDLVQPAQRPVRRRHTAAARRRSCAASGDSRASWSPTGSRGRHRGRRRAGLDLEMPGPAPLLRQQAGATRCGTARSTRPVLDAAVARLLRVLDRVGALDDPPDETPSRSTGPSTGRWRARGGGRQHRAAAQRRRPAVRRRLDPHAGSARPERRATRPSWAVARRSLAAHYRVTVLDALARPPRRPRRDRATSRAATSAAACHRSAGPAGGARRRAGLLLEAVDGDGPRRRVVDRCTGRNGEPVLRRPPSPEVRLGRFSARATAHVHPRRRPGRGWSRCRSAGRARLLVDGEVVLDGVTHPLPAGYVVPRHSAAHEVTATLELEAGRRSRSWSSSPNAHRRHAAAGCASGVAPAPPPTCSSGPWPPPATADAAVVVVGTNDEWESEGHDRETMDLPGDQDELVARVLRRAARTRSWW